VTTRYAKISWTIAAILVTYAAVGLLVGKFVKSGAQLPDWLQELYFRLLAAPLLILCRPWFPLLAKLGMMQGRFAGVPSPAGTLLVIGVYAALLTAAGFLVNQRR
jgi:hypothetical protein